MVQVVTHLRTLFVLAKKEAKAKESGNKTEYEKAKKEYEAYKKLCLESDKIITGVDFKF